MSLDSALCTESCHLVAAIEAGGTKFNCAIVSPNLSAKSESVLVSAQQILKHVRIPTRSPSETIGEMVSFLKSSDLPFSAIGVSSFGPIDLDKTSSTYGHITSTPKTGWRNTDLLGPLAEFNVPIVFDTDVNGAAYGEYMFGAARGLDTFVYYTIGTGIGGGGMVGGQLMHGLIHPEMGHMFIPHDSARDPFKGCCPSHGDCFEGLASGPALEQRWKSDPVQLPDDHPAWALEAHYIAVALANTTCMLSPQRIILGGGVMQKDFLFPLIREELKRLLNGYIQHRSILDHIDQFVVPPQLGSNAGVLGASALALST